MKQRGSWLEFFRPPKNQLFQPSPRLRQAGKVEDLFPGFTPIDSLQSNSLLPLCIHDFHRGFLREIARSCFDGESTDFRRPRCAEIRSRSLGDQFPIHVPLHELDVGTRARFEDHLLMCCGDERIELVRIVWLRRSDGETLLRWL